MAGNNGVDRDDPDVDDVELDDVDDVDSLEQDEEVEDSTNELSSDEIKSLRNEHTKMQQALAKANKEAKEQRLRLKRLREAGLDVDTAIELKQKMREDERKRAMKQGDVDKIKLQLEEQYTKQLSESQDRLSKMEKALNETLVSDKVGQALNELGAANGAHRIITPVIEKYIKVVDDDGRYTVVITDEDGDTRFNNEGKYMSIKEYISELRTDEVFSRLFVQTNNSGTGSSASGQRRGGGGKPQPKTRKEMSNTDKAAFIKEKGMEAYLALPMT